MIQSTDLQKELVGDQPPVNPSVAYLGFPSLEEFFNRTGFEVDIESLWKMNASQLEDAAQKQDKYIKNLRKNYKKVHNFDQNISSKLYEDLVPIFNKHQSCQQTFQELSAQIEQLQQAKLLNQSQNHQQQSPDLKITEVFDLHESYQQPVTNEQQIVSTAPQEDLQNSITIPKQELQILKDELDRIRTQCTSICQEMRRLQEDNDDLSMALDAEKSYKEKVLLKKEKELDEAYKKIKEQEAQYLLILGDNERFQDEKQQLKSKIDQSNISQQDITSQLEQQIENMKKTEEEQILRCQELQSRLTMELLKTQTLMRDLDRISQNSNAQKEEISQMFQKITTLEQQLQLEQSKRSRDKNVIRELQSRSVQHKQVLLEKEEQIKIYEIKIADLNKVDQDNFTEFNNKIEEKNQQIVQFQKELSDALMKLKELEDNIQSLNKSNENLNQSLSEKDKHIHKLNQTIELLQQKREYAIKEINTLSEKVQQNNIQLQKQTSQPSPQTEPSSSLKFVELLRKKRINVFQYLKHKSENLQKLVQIVYKEFLKILMEFEKDIELALNLHQSLIGLEKKINDCVISSQELEDVFEDLGI